MFPKYTQYSGGISIRGESWEEFDCVFGRTIREKEDAGRKTQDAGKPPEGESGRKGEREKERRTTQDARKKSFL